MHQGTSGCVCPHPVQDPDSGQGRVRIKSWGKQSKPQPRQLLCPWAGNGRPAWLLNAVLRCDRCRWASPWAYATVIPDCLSSFPIECCSSARSFPQQPFTSHLLHPGAPGGSQRLVQLPVCGAAAALRCNVSGHCLDLTLLPSDFAAEQRLKNRKQNKAVRKSGICVASLKAEWHSRQLGSGSHFGALARACFSWRGLDFITYFLFCRFASLDIFTTWFLG